VLNALQFPGSEQQNTSEYLYVQNN
jgi:hypothetical protein